MSISIIIREDNDLECLPGQKAYRCRGGLFKGCCSVDPCDENRCPDRDVKGTRSDGDANSGSTLKPTTIASIGPPLQWTGAVTTFSPTFATSTEQATPLTPTVASSFPQEPSSTPKLVVTSVASESLTPSPSILPTPQATTDSNEGNGNTAGLSPGAMGGIIGAVAAVVLGIIVAYFLCCKRGKRLRQSICLSSWKPHDHAPGIRDCVYPYTGPPPGNDGPMRDRGPLAPFEESYEETQSRYTRASAFTSSAMKNHPVDPTFRDDLSHDRIPAMATRPRETTPDLVRNDTSTPELHGSPKRAAVAELASPGPPRIIEISKPRPNSRTYKAYRPDAQLHPLYDASGANLGRESVAPLAERYQRPHVDGWTRWNRDS